MFPSAVHRKPEKIKKVGNMFIIFTGPTPKCDSNALDFQATSSLFVCLISCKKNSAQKERKYLFDDAISSE